MVCPVFESITVVSGRQLQVTVLAFFLLDYYTVFDEFGNGWWRLAPYWRWGRRNRLLLRRATGQKQAKHQPSFPHALCFPLSCPLVDGNLGYTPPTWTPCEGGQLADG